MLMFSLYIIGIIYNLLYCSLFSKYVLKEKFKITKKLFVISSILAIFSCLNFYFNKNALKPFISNLIGFITMKFYYNKSLGKTLVGLLISFIMVSASELVFALIIVKGLNITQEFLNNTVLGVLFTNFSVFIIVLIISNIKKAKKFINIIINSFNSYKTVFTIMIVVLCLTIVSFVIYMNLSEQANITYLIFINLFFIGVYVFMIGFFLEKDNNNNLLSKYDQLYEYSKAYEQELVKRSKRQHEYENQLIIIKSMVQDNDKDTIPYIDGLLKDDEKNKDIKWLSKLVNIPLGGLKGLLYFKLNEMMSKHINVNLEVSESLSKRSLWKTYTDNAQDISRIIGVYLDNAIEAASVADPKEIEIQIYLENKNIIFCLGNTFIGTIDESKLDEDGYSSKGTNRGYGLPLVKDILSKHDELEQERIVMDQYYVQNLIIKPKIK